MKVRRGLGDVGEPVRCDTVMDGAAAGPLHGGPKSDGAGGGVGVGKASRLVQDQAGELRRCRIS